MPDSTKADDEHPILNDEARIMKASVARVSRLSPHMAQVTLVSDDFRRMPDLGPDAFSYIFAPRPGEEIPDIDYDFSWDRWREQRPEQRAVGRYYTVRRFRPGSGEIDFQMLLHETGPLSQWAAQARPGMRVALWGPRASFALPSPTLPLVLAADHSGLPALASILESLPPAARGHAFVELDDARDRIEVETPPGVRLQWLLRTSESRGDLLVRAVTASEIAPPLYAWAGAENASVNAIRSHLKSIGVPARAICAIGYWRENPAAAAG